MKRYHQLPSAAWVNGGNIQIPCKDIPALARIRAFVFRLEAVFLTGAAQAAIVSTQLHRLISMIDAGPNARASGAYWRALEWVTRGGQTSIPFGIPATNASTFRRHLTWTIPFWDKRSLYPGDDCPVGADYADKVIQIETAAFAGLGAGTWDTLNAATGVTGTLRCYALLDEPNDAPGSVVKFGYADLTGQAPTLDGGLYADLFLYRENGAVITSVQVATASMQADGQALADIFRFSEYARIYNDMHGLGGDLETSSATAPVTGEEIPETPAETAGAADTVTASLLPLIVPAAGYKRSGLVRVENTLRVDYTGTDTSIRVGYRKIVPRTPGDAVQAFQRIGRTDVTSMSQISAKTASKRALSPAQAHLWRFLPLRATSPRR